MNQLPDLNAEEPIWPEEFATVSAADFERKAICAEHGRSLGRRMEQAVWDAYRRRHGAKAARVERRGRGFG